MNRCATLLVICFVVVAAPLAAQEAPPKSETTTWLVVRHADRDGGNDELTEQGKKRAKKLKKIAKSFRVNAIYSTNTNRTKSTAKPTASKLGLEINDYGRFNSEWFDQMKAKHNGDVILIVGHSNTVGPLVNGLGGEGDFSVEENEFDSLFVVTSDSKTTVALRLKFGQ